jgi:hypothetical protein
MIRSIALVLAVFAVGCAFDPARERRPARMMIGANARHFQAPIRSGDVAFRDSMPPPREMTVGHEAVAGSVQFTQGMRHHTYIGGELEAGALDEPGSSTAGAYVVSGIDLPCAAGSLGGELASGWRSVRYSNDTDDVSKIVFEPRLRAQVWLSEYITLAATGGMTLSEQQVFMAGVSIGIHSWSFGKWKPRSD